MTGTGRREWLELCQGGFGWISEKVLPPEGAGTAQAPQGMGTAPRLPELQESLDTAPGMHRGDCWGECAGTGTGLDDPWGSLPSQDFLWFCVTDSGAFQPGMSLLTTYFTPKCVRDIIYPFVYCMKPRNIRK